MVGRIKMKLGMQVGLAPAHIVLDGDPAPPPPKGHSPPIFGPYLLRQNGCMDQDVTWCGARHLPRRLCVRWGPRCPLPKRNCHSNEANVPHVLGLYLHDTTCCQTSLTKDCIVYTASCQTGCTTQFDNRFNEQLFVQHGCQTG